MRWPEGTLAETPDAVTVVAGGEARVTTELILTSRLGNHVAAHLFVEYANCGDVAMPAPVLPVTVSFCALANAG